MGQEIDSEWAQRMASAQFAQLIAEAMGVPLHRVSVELLPDIGLGRTGVAVIFDPPMTRSERDLLSRVLPFVCIAAGVSAPREWPDA